eukprot:4390739-Pyramimonas_sp.AAC.1
MRARVQAFFLRSSVVASSSSVGSSLPSPGCSCQPPPPASSQKSVVFASQPISHSCIMGVPSIPLRCCHLVLLGAAAGRS